MEFITESVQSYLGENAFVMFDKMPDTFWMFMGLSTLAAAVASSSFLLNKSNTEEEATSDETASEVTSPATDDIVGCDDSQLHEEGDEDGDESLTSGEMNTIRRIKLARQRVINKKIEETLTPKERVTEKMIQTQQLAKIYALLSENQDSTGQMSIGDIKKQMSMYTYKGD